MVIGIVFGVIGLLALLAGAYLRFLKKRATSTVVKAVAVEANATSAVSSTSASAGVEMKDGTEESKI